MGRSLEGSVADPEAPCVRLRLVIDCVAAAASKARPLGAVENIGMPVGRLLGLGRMPRPDVCGVSDTYVVEYGKGSAMLRPHRH